MAFFFFDTNKSPTISKPKSELSDYSLLTTVSENKEYFSPQEIKGADLSRKFQEYLFFPGPNTFKHYVNNNIINNCKITADDINRGELIYGPLEPYVAGHMVRHKPPVHNKIKKIPLSPIIAAHHSNIAMAMDFSSLTFSRGSTSLVRHNSVIITTHSIFNIFPIFLILCIVHDLI